MKLRDRFSLYLVCVHVLFAAIAAVVFHDRRILFPVVEVMLAISLLTGWVLIRARSRERELLATGAELLTERDFSTRFRPVGQPDLDALVELFNRMLDQLRAERLRAEEQQMLLEKLVARSPTGVVLLDHDRRVSDINPAAARLLGIDAEGARGKDVSALSSPIVSQALALKDGEGAMLGTGEGRRLRLWKGAFLDRGFSREFWLIEEMTLELRISERGAYEKVIRMLAHEINNSVGAVGSLLDSMSSWTAQLPEERRERAAQSLDIAATRLRHLASFTRELASVIRIPDPVPSEVSPGRLLADLITLLESDVESKAVRFELQQSGAATVQADLHQMEQVLLNILRNARESVGGEGTIHCSVVARERDVLIRIADSGPGLSTEAQTHLFTPFFSTKPGGRGLGLTIIHEVLTAHDANFTLRNRSEGGAEFLIALPKSFRGERLRS